MNLGHALSNKHALNGSAVEDVAKIASGEIQLIARTPTDENAVEYAEVFLNDSPTRPVYAFVGNLHPALGTVGLIIDRSWADREVSGVSRCDTGGLAAGHGGFQHVPRERREEALLEVSFIGSDVRIWSERFAAELAASYPRPEDYVEGAQPDPLTLTFPRRECIESENRSTGSADRRLWTWEVRCTTGPVATEVLCVVLSPGALSEYEDLRRRSSIAPLPPNVRLIVGRAPIGLAYFDADDVLRAFLAGAK